MKPLTKIINSIRGAATQGNKDRGTKNSFVAKVMKAIETSKRDNDIKDIFVWPIRDDVSFAYLHEVKFRVPSPTKLIIYGKMK